MNRSTLIGELTVSIIKDAVFGRSIVECVKNTTNPNDCPLGCICDGKGDRSRCKDFQTNWKIIGLGPLHDGAWCPEGSFRMRNCPKGYYCPDAETIYPCPKGYFCPHKTKVPEIKCGRCDEGAEVLELRLFGYVLFLCLGIFVILFSVFRYYKNRKINSKEYQESVEQVMYSSQRKFDTENVYKHRIQRMSSKLHSIYDRVSLLDETRTNVVDYFNAYDLFEAIDKNGDGVLQYTELSHALELNDESLKKLVCLMNDRAGESNEDFEVSRDTFTRYFVDAMDQASNFETTEQGAEELFLEIANDASVIDLNKLFQSRLIFILSYSEIYDLIEALSKDLDDNGINKPNPISRSGSEPHDEEGQSKGQFFTTANRKPTLQKGTATNLRPSLYRGNSVSSFVNNATTSRRDLLKDMSMNSQRRLTFPESHKIISKESFIARYAPALKIVTEGKQSKCSGMDIVFRDLSLHVTAGGAKRSVVKNVTGRLRRGTMTALMGGSGAGKSSLLNALCGRAHYGKVTGEIILNGHVTSIDKYADVVGFVPQDDVVYAELSVLENLIFAGKFGLPNGTSTSKITDLAMKVMARLGLLAIANSLVGDGDRRGVSGGERKRVSIGLELMTNPSVLFLDEPTSGLDASSAMLVMKSLKELVKFEGVTVCSVIHQPRKFIFDLFDSIILLGSGGQSVYHGPTNEVVGYFEKMNFVIPQNENVADWLIDISTGLVAPKLRGKKESESLTDNMRPSLTKKVIFLDQELTRNSIMGLSFKGTSILVNNASRCVADDEKSDAERALINRTTLFKRWNDYFNSMPNKEFFDPPEPYQLPSVRRQRPFINQLASHLYRNFIVQSRSLRSAITDTIVISAGMAAICLMKGPLELTSDADPLINDEYNFLTSVDPDYIQSRAADALLELYKFVSHVQQMQFGLTIALMVSSLSALSASKVITEKRNQTFREAASGYDLNAYFLSINITSTIQFSLQALLYGLIANWLRRNVSSIACSLLNYVLIVWNATSWGIFFSTCTPPKNVTIVVAFFIVFFGLMFSGGMEPTKFEDIYNNTFSAILSGFFSPIRYFLETSVVSDFRALPPQSGFTISDDFSAYDDRMNLFNILHLAQNDMPNVSKQSLLGWYHVCLPSFLSGLTVRFAASIMLQLCNRSKQSKPKVLVDIRRNKTFRIQFLFMISCFLVLLFFTMKTIEVF